MDISGMSQSQFTYELLKKGLDASSERQNVISNNLANINTKGYKRSYVTFEDNLKDSVDNLEMIRTDSRHINDGAEYGGIEVKTDNTTSMNEDGNNVDIDTEMTNEAQNTLKYYALTSEISRRISMTGNVINGK
ncbi:flagellar basal body rod protein FlgB [Clostridium guangxiense]|uniref:flagellar basal body rod protein FlgB n=2 Tax=Clostridium TaxID=1485 RepID=UPI00069F8E83|nr:flagellar basal body rod protein FlgB [Clostridium sp. DMHC 10]